GPLVKGVKHSVKLGAKAVSGATSGSKATNKTVNLAKSPTPTNPTKQQAPSPPAKSKDQGTGSSEKVTKPGYVPRIREIEVEFTRRNPKHDSKEFARQLKDQEEGINELTVDEFIKNRDRYLKDGRAIEGDAAQKLARKKALQNKVDELRRDGLSYEEAEKKANEWIKGQAALHNPDQIAGGNPTKIGGLGDKDINSSIGSQWRSRIKDLDKQVRAIGNNMTEEERKTTYLNIKLKH
ncbi:polymorphic toxin type 15 domain-containing protein, partial [Solibacillus ferritrahens]|uniref:polymorphic toxin type 15 domain-containing protein n=1 Tax=Solibacillus ferritrahens TaxID=3098620 RepID=UPI00300876B0